MGKEKTILRVVLLLCFALQSCTSQEIDLLSTKFPSDKSILIEEKADFEKDKFNFDTTLDAYKFTNSDKFNVGGNDIFKSIDKNSASYSGQNYIDILTDKSAKIQGFLVHTYTEKESLQLLKSLQEKFGKPNYDDADVVDRHIVWENANATYIFNLSYEVKINDIKTIEGNLYALNNNLTKLVLYLNSTTHYESYLQERTKQNKKLANYSSPISYSFIYRNIILVIRHFICI